MTARMVASRWSDWLISTPDAPRQSPQMTWRGSSGCSAPEQRLSQPLGRLAGRPAVAVPRAHARKRGTGQHARSLAPAMCCGDYRVCARRRMSSSTAPATNVRSAMSMLDPVDAPVTARLFPLSPFAPSFEPSFPARAVVIVSRGTGSVCSDHGERQRCRAVPARGIRHRHRHRVITDG